MSIIPLQVPFVNTIFHCFGSFFHSFVLRECVELYIYLSFVYFSICWVLFHTMPPFAFVFCRACRPDRPYIWGVPELMVDIAGSFLTNKWFCGGFILSQPSADCSLCGGSLLGGAFRKASPERGGARRKRAEGFVPQRWLVAAALSAAVTSSQKQKNAPNAHGRARLKESSSLFPAALRVGARGRGKTAIAASGG